MLRVLVKGEELWNETKNEFVPPKYPDVTLELEHSLLSVSKWESKYEKPFLVAGKTVDEIYDYIKAMVVTPDVDLGVLDNCPQEVLSAVQEYINSNQTATTFGHMPERRGRGEIITAELIYFWMVNFNIPFECEKWHLNRLFALIRICNIKNSKPKRMSRNEMAQRNKEINDKRRAELNTKG
jgi:hypothetical protein